MIISLSIQRIAEGIYARAALDAASKGVDTPPALSRRNAPALHRLIADTAVAIAAQMGDKVLGVTHPDQADIITIEYQAEQYHHDIVCLRVNIETAVACTVMAQACAAHNALLAQWYSRLAKASQACLPQKIMRG